MLAGSGETWRLVVSGSPGTAYDPDPYPAPVKVGAYSLATSRDAISRRSELLTAARVNVPASAVTDEPAGDQGSASKQRRRRNDTTNLVQHEARVDLHVPFVLYSS